MPRYGTLPPQAKISDLFSRLSPSGRRRLALTQAYQSVFSSPEGKMVLYDLIDEHGVLGNVMSPDARETAYRDGQRMVVLRIIDTLRMDWSQLEHLLDEQQPTENSAND